jgi:light-regulated signal transduction histidine kinase (bacteriophytochrome)
MAINILIADDDEGDRKQLRRLLQQTDVPVECVEVASIEDALAACEMTEFHCAILDYLMPGHDGLHGIEVMRARRPNMAVVMLTGQGDETVAAEAMKRGAHDYISKTQIAGNAIQRSIEAAIEKSDERRRLEQQKEELDEFTYSLAHDLKAPLRSIRKYAEAVEENVHEAALSKASEDCRRIIRATNRMDRLITALYGYTQAETQFAFEPVAMEGVLRDALANLEELIAEQGARVTHDPLPAVLGSEPLLMQLLQNLVGNGLKYRKDDAPPAIHIGTGPEEGDYWRFAVADNGIGIPEDYHETIFQAFKRLHGVEEYEGTGLGLATCRKIVERHGGRIWCESKPSEGTTFLFTLKAPAKPQNRN